MNGGAQPQPDPHTTPQIGDRLRQYLLVDLLGRGGMASVFLAKSVYEGGFTKWLAIKLIQAVHGVDKKNIEAMFFDEAVLAARISHPNVSQIFELQRSEWGPYIVMEYLHGQPLSSVLSRAWKGRGIAHECIARIFADVARGLHAAHELRGEHGELSGVVHRDISPQNIFVLYDGVAKVVDFGIARFNERTVQETGSQELRGKLRYMAPEQVLHEPVDRRTDIFALGIVLWESTLGRRLFTRDNPGAIVRAIIDDPIPRPSSFEPEYPPLLEAIVMKALERDPADRFQSAEELCVKLEEFLQASPNPGTSVRLATEMQQLFWSEKHAREVVLNTRSASSDAERVASVDASTVSAPTRAKVPQSDFTTQGQTSSGVHFEGSKNSGMLIAMVVLACTTIAAVSYAVFATHGQTRPTVTPLANAVALPPQQPIVVAPTLSLAVGVDASSPHTIAVPQVNPGDTRATTTARRSNGSSRPHTSSGGSSSSSTHRSPTNSSATQLLLRHY